MNETRLTWQGAIQYVEEARRTNWTAEKLDVEYLPHATLLEVSPRMKVRDMRDWINQSVGQKYLLTGIFGSNQGKGKLHIPIPSLFRFSFQDMETAMLFKLTWL
jgi:hypothetical protein